MDNDAVELAAAAFFFGQRAARPQGPQIPPQYQPADICAGYRLQHTVHNLMERSGLRRVGYKVGATSKSGQAAFGIDEPVYAGLFAHDRKDTLVEALAIDLAAPALECEVALLLGTALDARTHLPDRRQVFESIETCHLGCEIIDHRYSDTLARNVPSLLADDFFQAAFVLGPAVPAWREIDLTDLYGTIAIDQTIIRGRSRDVLDPISSLQWLASALARSGRILARGELVFTGSIVTPTPIRLPAGHVEISIDGFQSLR